MPAPVIEPAPHATPPISIACRDCGDGEMRLISIEPEIGRVLFVYECRNKHRHEIVVGGK